MPPLEIYKFSDESDPMVLKLRREIFTSNSKPASSRKPGADPLVYSKKFETRYSDALKTDAASVIKSAGEGDINALAAILTNNTTIRSELFPDIFLMACSLLNPDKLRMSSETPDPKSSASSSKFPSPDAERDAFRLAVVALFVLACYGMSEAVEKQQSTFANLMMKNLSDLFSGMKAIYENHRDTHLGIPKTKIGLSSLISNVFLSMFGNTAVFVMLKRQVEVRKFLWILWLYGGPATGEENTLVNHCASAACIARISLAGDTGYSLISDLLGVYTPFGGQEAAAKITLTGAHHSILSNEHILDVPQHSTILSIFHADKQGHAILKKMAEMDGIAKLIEGLTELATTHRSKVNHPGMDTATETLFKILKHLLTRNHRNAEQSGRCGILQMLLAFAEPSKEGIQCPSGVLEAAGDLLKTIPRYFVYHSVITTFGEEMRKLTEGDIPKDSVMVESELSEKWRELKRALFDRYATMRFFDVVIARDLGLQSTNSCNNCGEVEGEKKFQACSACKKVYYCSKKCQTEDWRYEGHRQDCPQKNDRYYKDTQFLCFLANFYVYTRYLLLLAHSEDRVAPSRAVFRAHFCWSSLEPVFDVVDASVAKRELDGYVSSPPPNMSYNVKNSPPQIRENEVIAAADSGVPTSPSVPPIEVTVFDCLDTMVVRHVAMDRKTRRYQGGVAGSMPSTVRKQGPNDCVYRERINPLTDDGMLMVYQQDVVDRLLLNMELGDGGDPWAYHLSEANERRYKKVAHAFEVIEEFMCEEDSLRVFQGAGGKIYI